MNEQEIYLPQWQELSNQRRLDIFQQIIRYFVRPLWPVTNIRPLKMQFGQTTIVSCQADLNYQTFIFVPGNLAGQFADGVKAISPFMIARTATAANLLLIGELNVVNGEVNGDQALLKPFASEIDAFLYRRRNSLDPFVKASQTEATSRLVFQETRAEHLSLYVQKDWSYVALRRQLRSVGCNLATKNQWEYSTTGDLTPFELPINQDWQTPDYYQSGYGAAFTTTKNQELLNDPGIVKANPFQIDTSSTTAVLKSINTDYDINLPTNLTPNFVYRPVINVQLD
ncbi:hypothetical protein [Lapidilactobacillus bayanensis]|uniref:hypothetical protein n=1 Tax=Lapidilactobacillus bayanensis TaxID=2485998 RepID=UPI000F76D92D|nr:hypothetical protein [Lapidilactobacillus bayanensis]